MDPKKEVRSKELSLYGVFLTHTKDELEKLRDLMIYFASPEEKYEPMRSRRLVVGFVADPDIHREKHLVQVIDEQFDYSHSYNPHV